MNIIADTVDNLTCFGLGIVIAGPLLALVLWVAVRQIWRRS